MKRDKRILLINNDSSYFFLLDNHIKQLGYHTVIIQPLTHYNDLQYDGIIISGGHLPAKCGSILKWYKKIFGSNIPILGICRGMQMINVALGGTLYQDTRMLYTETPNIRSILPRKPVYLIDDSKLKEILGVKKCLVNSLHNQAIKELGAGLFITATENFDIAQFY